METQIIVTIKQDGKKVEEKRWEEEENHPGYHIYSDDDETTEEEAERQAVASDLANVCEYLEEKDVIAIKLIIQRARKRKERAGK